MVESSPWFAVFPRRGRGQGVAFFVAGGVEIAVSDLQRGLSSGVFWAMAAHEDGAAIVGSFIGDSAKMEVMPRQDGSIRERGWRGCSACCFVITFSVGNGNNQDFQRPT